MLESDRGWGASSAQQDLPSFDPSTDLARPTTFGEDRAAGRHRHRSSTTRLIGWGPRSKVDSRVWWCVAIAITLALIVMSVALGGHRRDNPQLDDFDEGSHYAYVVALHSGHIPAWGDTLSYRERELVDCLQSASPPPEPCNHRPAPVRDYLAKGYDYEAQQPPLGYLPYVLTANPQANPAAAITSARNGGIIWVVISGLLLLVFAALEDFSLLSLTALIATCLLDPIFTYAAGTVNNDAAGVAAAAVGLIAWSWSRRRPRYALGLGLVAGVLIGLTKGLFVVVPFALVVAALVEEGGNLLSWSGIRKACRRHLCAASMLAATIVAYGAFTVIQGARASVPSSVVLNDLLGFSKTTTVQPSIISNGITSMFTLFEPSTYQFDALNVIWGVCAFGVLAAVWFFVIPNAIARRVRGLSLGTALGMVGLAVGWTLLVFVQGHYNFAGAVRYAIPLLPLIGYVIVVGCRRLGIVTVGILLPVACGILQLAIGKY
jgi:hypothetical protein